MCPRKDGIAVTIAMDGAYCPAPWVKHKRRCKSHRTQEELREDAAKNRPALVEENKATLMTNYFPRLEYVTNY